MNHNVVSFFCGCGGFDVGFENAGYDILLANDYWEPAVKTYRENFDSPIVSDDVRDIDDERLFSLLSEQNTTADEIDMVIGGPPCQGFSRLNNKQIELDQMEQDDRNTLFHEFLRVANSLDPKVIIMENVRDLINRKMSDDTYVKDAIVKTFNEYDYNCEYTVLNAEEYGVPQKRRRIIFYGVKDGISVEPEELFPEKTHTDGEYKTAGEALEGISDDLPNMTWRNTQEKTLEKIRHIPQGGYYADLPDRLKTKKNGEIVKRFGTHLRRLDEDEPSLTVSTNEFIHPTKNRYLTPREMARLQTFDDTFEFIGNKGDVLQQIGNAVPPKLAEVIATNIDQTLSGTNNE